MMNDKTYTIKELSKITGLSVIILRRYLKGGKINAQMIDGTYHIPEQEAEKVINLAKEKITDPSNELKIVQDNRKAELLKQRIRELEQDKMFLQKDIEARNNQIDHLLNEVKRLNDQIRLMITPQITGKVEPVTIFTIAGKVKSFFTRSSGTNQK